MKSSELLFNKRVQRHAHKTDRLFVYLFTTQWCAAIAIALFYSPSVWPTEFSEIHIHFYAAVFLGGLIAGYPIYLIKKNPGAVANRMVNAVAQMLYSILFIHLTGGRIETHFHIFVSMAFLASYNDVRPIILATLVTIGDHFVRGALWPQSIYGVLSAHSWTAFEHGAWVLFEDLILFYSIRISRGELKSISDSQLLLQNSNLALKQALVTVEVLNSTLESRVDLRTQELRDSQKLVMMQQETLMTTAKMSALGEMAGGIAHEINNPLGIIQGKSNLLLKHLKLGSFTLQIAEVELKKIVTMTERVSKIITGLRTFSRNADSDPVVATP